jgi:hypothetical protein
MIEKLLNKFGFIKKVKHQDIINQVNSNQREKYQKELEELSGFTKKFIDINLVDADYFKGVDYKLVLELNQYLVQSILRPMDNSRRALDYIAQDVGYRVAYELKTINFIRLKDYERGLQVNQRNI